MICPRLSVWLSDVACFTGGYVRHGVQGYATLVRGWRGWWGLFVQSLVQRCVTSGSSSIGGRSVGEVSIGMTVTTGVDAVSPAER